MQHSPRLLFVLFSWLNCFEVALLHRHIAQRWFQIKCWNLKTIFLYMLANASWEEEQKRQHKGKASVIMNYAKVIACPIISSDQQFEQYSCHHFVFTYTIHKIELYLKTHPIVVKTYFNFWPPDGRTWYNTTKNESSLKTHVVCVHTRLNLLVFFFQTGVQKLPV